MTPALTERLRPHQRELAEHLSWVLRQYHTGVDISKTGTGKTYVAAAVAADSKLPFLVVCPKIAQTQWAKAAEHFNDKFSIVGWEMLRTGRTPFGTWEKGYPPASASRRYYKCTNCQCEVDIDPRNFRPCFAHHLGIHCLDTKTRPHSYGRFNFHPAVRGVIFDEIHRARKDSLNSDMVIGAKRSGLKMLGLSATPAQSPLDMRALGYMLDLHRLTDFQSWTFRYGCRRIPRCGVKWLASKADQLNIMNQIRREIVPARGVYRDTKDIPGFPKCDIRAELFDLPGEAEKEAMDRLYREMADSLDRLNARSSLDIAPELSLTKILRERQKIELLKIPMAVERGVDKLEAGFSVVWFVNFTETVSELKKRFPDAGVIDGSDTRYRQLTVDTFQQNLTNKLIVNIGCGGEALSVQDLDGEHPRYGLAMPNFSAMSMRQMFGRLPRDGGKSNVTYEVLFAAGTIDTKVHAVLSRHLNNMDALTDGDLDPRNLICD